MNIKALNEYLKQHPIEKIPLDWDSGGYTAESFNDWAGQESFTGWIEDLSTEKEVDIISRLLDVTPNSLLLDIACGYGRHSLMFADKYKLKVSGIDISQGLIKSAKRFANQKGVDIDYKVQHARDIGWHDTFDCAVILYNSFSLFSPEDVPIILNRINNALKKGGKIFIDLDNKPCYCDYGTLKKDWEVFQDRIKFQELYFYEDTSIEVNRDIYVLQDSNVIEDFVIFKKIYSRKEICDLLESNGFKISDIYGGWDLSKLDENSEKIIIIGIKKAK